MSELRARPTEHEVLLRAIFEVAHDAIGVSKNGVHTMVNPAYVRLFGYADEAELVGTPILDLIAPAERAVIRERVARRFRGEAVEESYVTCGLRRDGSTFDMLARVSPYELGGEIYTLVVLRDITAERETEKALEQSRELRRAIWDVNTAIKLLIDPIDGRIVDANAAAVEFYGWSVDQLRQMRVADINTLPDELIRAEMDAARAQRRQYFVFRHRTASGEVRDVEVYSGPIDMQGRRLLLSILHDVTDRKRLEEQLQHAQKMEAIGQLAGGIAHDFNNLLTLIIGYADELLGVAPPDSPMRGPARQIMKSALRAEELTHKLLAFGRRQVLEVRSVDLNDVLADIEPLLRRLIGEAVTLELDLDRALGFCLADPGQIEQVVMNLAVNARDAMPKGGTLTLRTATATVSAEDGRPELRPGRYVTLAVRDTGVGMDEAVRARVFEPFFTTKEKHKGTGLGLSTAYGIIRQSGGHIAVESAPGQGATFTLWLPRADCVGKPDPAVAPGPAEGATAPRCTVLVVEDQDDLREFLRSSLQGRDYDVYVGRDGVEALDWSRRFAGRIDLLVTDVVMPRMNGPELHAALRADRPGLPVLYISGWPDGLVDTGDAAFLAKPFTGPALRKKIAEVLGR